MLITKRSNTFFGISRHILIQAWPILVSQLAGMAFAVIDTMMLGHFSAISLQTISLAASIYVTVNISLMGVIHALIPISAQLIGAKKIQQVGDFWGQGFWLSWFVSICGGILLLFPNIWLSVSGDNLSPHVRDEVTTYLRIVFLSLPATLMFRVIYSLCTASQHTRQLMYVSLVSVLIKFALNYLLIFGPLGLPAMGSMGAAISTTVVSWFMLFFGFFFIWIDPYYKQFELKLGWPKWLLQKELLKLGLPMGGSYFVEVTAFTFMALLSAREGTFASGAHQILSNLVSILYIMPMSLGITTSSLTAQALGARKPALAHRIVMNGYAISTIGACLSIVLVLVAKPFIVSLYTQDPYITPLALGLLSIIPLLHLMDAFQCMGTFILRAHKIATIPFILQALCLSCIGLGGGYYFGYGAGKGSITVISDILTPGAPSGVASLWIMNSLGLVTCATALFIWYYQVAHAKK